MSFESPTDGQKLDVDDDSNGDSCEDGFQYDVRLTTDAPDDSVVTLFAGGQKLADGRARGGELIFRDVRLGSQGETRLIAAVNAGSGCEAEIDIEVDCGLPTCTITQPTLGPTHPQLNGTPASQGGDRTSAIGAPYQTAFRVSTNIADGQPVILRVDESNGSFSAVAQGGVASFPQVTLDPDGTYTVEATCFGADGLNGRSAAGLFEVDTQAPQLTVQKATTPPSLLENGDHFGMTSDSNPEKEGLQFRICGATNSADALGLSATLGSRANNFCVGVGTSSPTCSAATAGGGLSSDGACVELDCPGGGLFSLNVSLNDTAGNVTTRTIENLTCASTNPQVQFLDPIGDTAPFADVTKRILAADNLTATRKDKNPNVLGSQYDVYACTTVASGTARLLGGLTGSSLTEIATGVVAPAASGQCPSGFAGVVGFLNATLPESSTKTVDGIPLSLDKPTQLIVEVTDISTAQGVSAPVNVWVDSTNPNLAISFPIGFCGSFINSADSTYTIPMLGFATPVGPVTVQVAGRPDVVSTAPVNFGTVTLSSLVVLSSGSNLVSATTVEPSGNRGQLEDECLVGVGTVPPPVVTWETPRSTNRLTATTANGSISIPDADPGTPGWQGELKVCTNIDLTANPGATVQFSTVGGGDIGAPVILEVEGTKSCATVANATVPEGASVQLRATTSTVTGPEGEARGSATIALPVDVTSPEAIGNLAAQILNRRATSFRLSWTAPADAGTSVASYQVRVSETIINTPAAFDAATLVNYSSTPSSTGSADGVDVLHRIIERDNYFAVAAVDAVGNVGPIEHTTTPLRAEFKTKFLEAPLDSKENFGSPTDGSVDLNNDGYSDIIVGNLLGSHIVRVYFGSADGPSTTPSITLTGAAFGFGASVAAVDLNRDGFPELVIGSPQERRVYVFAGRAVWSDVITDISASTILSVDADADAAFATSLFGFSLARLGDFDGDGVEDLAIGASGYDGVRGLVAILLGRTGALDEEIIFPAAFEERAIRLEGAPGTTGNFGFSLLGLGNFSSQDKADLIVAAPNLNSNRGAVYAFHGRAHANGTIYASEADFSLTGDAAERLGSDGFSALGRLGPLSQPAFGLPLPYADSNRGRVRLYSGLEETGPFDALLGNLRTQETPLPTRSFGRSLSGGGFSGTNTSVSFLRGSAPDLVIPSRAGSAPKLFFLSAETIATLGSTLTTVESVADLTYPLPTPWTDFGRNVTALRDVDGDGYGDIAVNEVGPTSAVDGRVLVLH